MLYRAVRSDLSLELQDLASDMYSTSLEFRQQAEAARETVYKLGTCDDEWKVVKSTVSSIWQINLNSDALLT